MLSIWENVVMHITSWLSNRKGGIYPVLGIHACSEEQEETYGCPEQASNLPFPPLCFEYIIITYLFKIG